MINKIPAHLINDDRVHSGWNFPLVKFIPVEFIPFMRHFDTRAPEGAREKHIYPFIREHRTHSNLKIARESQATLK